MRHLIPSVLKTNHVPLAAPVAGGAPCLEPAGGPAAVARLQELLEARFGLAPGAWQREPIERALASQVTRAHRIALHPSPDELRALAEQIAVGETYFFRERAQIDLLVDSALPELAQRRAGAPVRVLSAGCASGEEPYSLAIALERRRACIPVPGCTILGVDMSPESIRRARRGRYSSWSLRAVQEDVRRRFFRPDSGAFQLRDDIRGAVSFEERNLLEEDPCFWAPGAFDVILCRNVGIYLSVRALRALAARFARALAPGGLLLLGSSESLRGISDELEPVHAGDTFYYRKGLRAPSLPPQPVALAAPPAPQPAAPVTADRAHLRRASERMAALRAARAAPSPQRAAADAREAVLALLRAERFDDALARAESLPAEQQRDPEVKLLRAVLLCNLGRVAEAEALSAEALSADGCGARARHLIGLCREHEGRRDGAALQHREAIRLDPGFAMPRLRLGLLARRGGDAAAARAELSRALELLAVERADRILLFGGGFRREALIDLCRAELRALGGHP